MITKEELVTALTEMVDDDLSRGGIEFIATELLEQFVLFERPAVGVVEEHEGGTVSLDGGAFPEYSVAKIEEWYEESNGAAEVEIYRLMQAYGLLEYYRKEATELKAARREELVKEAGADTFEELPPMLQKLIIRLVDAELASARD